MQKRLAVLFTVAVIAGALLWQLPSVVSADPIVRTISVHAFPIGQGSEIVELQMREGAIIIGVEWARNRPGLLAAEIDTNDLVTRSIRIVKNDDQISGNPGTLVGHVVNDNGPDSQAYALVFFDMGES